MTHKSRYHTKVSAKGRNEKFERKAHTDFICRKPVTNYPLAVSVDLMYHVYAIYHMDFSIAG